MSDLRFQNKSVVVTGAAAGMGKEITLSFIKEGASVIAVDINEQALAALKSEVAALDAPGKIFLFVGDVSTESANEQMIETAVRENGRLDILVNNAGVAGKSEPVTEVTNESWDRILKVDLNGPMYAIRAAVRVMLKQGGGSIVTIASVAGLKSCRSSVAYTVAKHGLVGLCEHTAYTYMHLGIRSNMVCPGFIKTGMTSTLATENPFGRERILSGMDPKMPFGVPSDIANAVLFLASDASKFINGAALVVDGGTTCN